MSDEADPTLTGAEAERDHAARVIDDLSQRLNAYLATICDEGELYPVTPLARISGKAIAYIGWYWREVDFRRRIHLGYCDEGDGWSFVGFMENNKWDYPEWVLSAEQSGELLLHLFTLQEQGATLERLQRLYDYMQTLRP